MRLAKPIFLALLTVAVASYAFDCGATATPEQAMECCNSMPCSSQGHHGQDCCKTMPAMHAPFVQPSSVHGISYSPVVVAVLTTFDESQRRRFICLATMQSIPTLRPSPTHSLPRLFVFSLSSSRLPAQRIRVLGNGVLAGGRSSVRLRLFICLERRMCLVVVAPRVFWCTDSKRARLRSRDSPSAVPRRRTHLLQLHLHDTRVDAGIIGEHPSDGPSHFFTRRRFQFHVGLLPQF